MNRVAITHLTTVHPRHDTRILYRECASLARATGGGPNLLVLDGLTQEERCGVHVRSLGRPPANRLDRFIRGNWLALRALWRTHGIVHFHDPELMIAMALLSLSRRRAIVFDVHEDVRKSLVSKAWIPSPLRRVLSVVYGVLERLLTARMRFILAEDSYAKYYRSKPFHLVHNYVDCESIRTAAVNADRAKRFSVGYLGSCTIGRGLLNGIRAVRESRRAGHDASFLMVGAVEAKLRDHREYQDAIAGGWLVAPGRVRADEAWALLSTAKIGLATLLPEGNYTESYPTKIFEYMALGLPVIASNFPLYRSVVETGRCGICVDPESIEQIAEAIARLMQMDGDSFQRMADAGRTLTELRYNWASERKVLLEAYEAASKSLGVDGSARESAEG